MSDCSNILPRIYYSRVSSAASPVLNAPERVRVPVRPRISLKRYFPTLLFTVLMLLVTCPCAFADTFFGISVDTGDQKVSWLGREARSGGQEHADKMNFSVSDKQTVEKADRWNPSYETDIDYGAYIKSFKLFLVIRKAF